MSTDEALDNSAAEVRAAVTATYQAFLGAGFAFASWASRIPQVRDRFGLSAAALGLVLLAVASGSLLALPLSAVLINRLTTRVTTSVMAYLVAVALVTVGTGLLIGVVPLLAGLFVLGLANGAWDVAMNVQGANVEQRIGRAIMPRFHAAYSLGTVAGGLLGLAMIALRIPVTIHLVGVAAIIAFTVPVAVRQFLPDLATATGSEVASAEVYGVLSRWREPRTLLVGTFVLAFAFAEGAGNDWIGLVLIDGYHASAVVGTLGLVLFLAAMTAVRWLGTELLDRHGRVVVVRALAIVAIVGVGLFVFGRGTPVALLGVVLWGAGASLGFPVGMSAAADDPAAAAARVSVVAALGYCAFLGGPPFIGFLGAQEGIRQALIAVGVLLAVATVLAAALRPPTPTPPT